MSITQIKTKVGKRKTFKLFSLSIWAVFNFVLNYKL